MQHRKIPQTERQPDAARRKGPHPTDRHVGNRVARLRSQLRMTQAELALKVGLSIQQIQKYENARNRISASILHQIAICLGVPVGRLFEGLPQADLMTEVGFPQSEEHLAFLSSVEGQRLNDGLLALSPKMRRRIATLVETIGTELSIARISSGETEG